MKGPGITERILYLHIRILYLCILSSFWLLLISLTNSVKDVSILCTPVLRGDSRAVLALTVRDPRIFTDRRLPCGCDARSAGVVGLPSEMTDAAHAQEQMVRRAAAQAAVRPFPSPPAASSSIRKRNAPPRCSVPAVHAAGLQSSEFLGSGPAVPGSSWAAQPVPRVGAEPRAGPERHPLPQLRGPACTITGARPVGCVLRSTAWGPFLNLKLRFVLLLGEMYRNPV